MKVGVKVNAPIGPVTWATVRDMALAADSGGLDSVWSEDHHFEPYGGPWDVWSMLAALSAVTAHVSLAPIVASTNYYPSPVIFARKAAAVHEISGGRLILGLGAGSGTDEYRKLGLPFDHPVGRFDEAFEIIRRLFDGERFDFEGRFHQLVDTWLSPLHRAIDFPERGHPSGWLDSDWTQARGKPLAVPLMAGTLGPRMLRILLPHVDGWNVHWSDRPFWNQPDRFPDVADTISDAATNVGRDPESLWTSAEIWMQFDDPHGLPIRVPPDLEPLPPTPDTIHECAAAGIDHLIVLADPQTPEAVETLANLVNECNV